MSKVEMSKMFLVKPTKKYRWVKNNKTHTKIISVLYNIITNHQRKGNA
jgi:hypothetical protein